MAISIRRLLGMWNRIYHLILSTLFTHSEKTLKYQYNFNGFPYMKRIFHMRSNDESLQIVHKFNDP